MKKLIASLLLFVFFFFALPVMANEAPQFPTCSSLTPPGDHAHYSTGLHQIFQGELLEGQDDVYSTGDGNFVQCFCPDSGNGIQTNWWRTNQEKDGWSSENGDQWNLGDYQYLAQNINYSCKQPSVTPSDAPKTDDSPSNHSQSPGEEEYRPSVCTKELPSEPTFTYRRLDNTSVKIFWNENMTNLTHYGVSYGYEENNLPFGIASIVKEATEVTIGALASNTPIWIQLHAYNTGDCRRSSKVIDP